MTSRLWPVMLGMLVCACAASPQKPPVAVATAAAASQRPAVPSEETELNKQARRMGYRVEVSNGERRYCQYNASTSSRIAQMHCFTEGYMAQVVRSQEEIKNRLSQPSSQLCPGCVQQK